MEWVPHIPTGCTSQVILDISAACPKLTQHGEWCTPKNEKKTKFRMDTSMDVPTILQELVGVAGNLCCKNSFVGKKQLQD